LKHSPTGGKASEQGKFTGRTGKRPCEKGLGSSKSRASRKDSIPAARKNGDRNEELHPPAGPNNMGKGKKKQLRAANSIQTLRSGGLLQGGKWTIRKPLHAAPNHVRKPGSPNKEGWKHVRAIRRAILQGKRRLVKLTAGGGKKKKLPTDPR